MVAMVTPCIYLIWFPHSVPEAILHQDSDTNSDIELHKEDIEDIIANYHIKQDKKLAERLKASLDENEDSIKSNQETNNVNDSVNPNNQVCGNGNQDNQANKNQISGNKANDSANKNQQDCVVYVWDDDKTDRRDKFEENGKGNRDGGDKNQVGGNKNQNNSNKRKGSGKHGGTITKETDCEVVEVEFQPPIRNEKEPHFVEISVGGGEFVIFNILFVKIDTLPLWQ